jgi:thymidylate synthase
MTLVGICEKRRMTLGNEFGSLEAAQRWALECALSAGHTVSPRGMPTREVAPAAFTLSNPRRRVITTNARKWSLPLAIGELCWHLSGSDEVEALTHYAPRWREFADPNGRIRGSCYGAKIFSRLHDKHSQWDLVIRVLKDDIHSRRATLIFSDSLSNSSAFDVDISCTIAIQFMIRD